MPGFCAKAAFSFEKSQDLWRQNETQKDIMIQKEKGWFWRPSYDVRLKESHAAVSRIFGGSCTAWFQDGYNQVAVDMRGDEGNSRSNKKRTSALAKRVINGLKSSSANSAKDPMSSLRINLTFQQQVFLFIP
ncbi:hypothetical protein ACFX2K_040700 [Malus domestica]